MKEKEAFYIKVAEVLKVDYEFQQIPPYKRRWGQRRLGNGRFPGIGLIRWFSPRHIQVNLLEPQVISEVFDDEEKCLNFLSSVFS